MVLCNKSEKTGNVAEAMTKNKALPTNETNSSIAVQHFVILDGNNSIKNKIVEARAIVSGETVRDNI